MNPPVSGSTLCRQHKNEESKREKKRKEKEEEGAWGKGVDGPDSRRKIRLSSLLLLYSIIYNNDNCNIRRTLQPQEKQQCSGVCPLRGEREREEWASGREWGSDRHGGGQRVTGEVDGGEGGGGGGGGCNGGEGHLGSCQDSTTRGQMTMIATRQPRDRRW